MCIRDSGKRAERDGQHGHSVSEARAAAGPRGRARHLYWPPHMAARNDTLARALALLNSGQAAQAEAMLRRSLSQGGAEAEHLLGLALAQQRKGEQAEFFLR